MAISVLSTGSNFVVLSCLYFAEQILFTLMTNLCKCELLLSELFEMLIYLSIPYQYKGSVHRTFINSSDIFLILSNIFFIGYN